MRRFLEALFSFRLCLPILASVLIADSAEAGRRSRQGCHEGCANGQCGVQQQASTVAGPVQNASMTEQIESSNAKEDNTDAFLARHNEIRQQRGLGRLTLCPDLCKQAQGHSNLMASRGGNCFYASPAGPHECVSWAQSPGSINHVDWLAIIPPHVGHDKQMLDPNVKTVGYGRAVGRGGEYFTMLAQ